MRVSREELLRKLESVGPGLATKELVEQTSCYVFSEGVLQTYNEEIACSVESPVEGIHGAVQAAPLRSYLQKLTEDAVELEQTESELIVKGKRREAGIRMEATVILPVDHIEKPEADAWRALPAEFSEAVKIVAPCASTDESKFAMTCIHLTSKYVEACDNYQMARYRIKLPLDEAAMVRKDSLKHVAEMGMTEYAETKKWLHFRNPLGVTLSCRRYVEDYEDLGPFFDFTGTPTQLPPGLVEATEKATIFSSESETNQVAIELRPGKLRIEGKGNNGWSREIKKVVYEGEPIKFFIDPTLLVELLKTSNECEIGPGRLLVKGHHFRYVACLGVTDEE